MVKTIIINAGTGNLSSVLNTLTKIGVAADISNDPEDIDNAERLILPGVGAFGEFMLGLTRQGLINPIIDFIKSGRPILGICVGMQALFELSEEMGQYAGLGLIEGKVLRFPGEINLKIPHTGWNQISFNSQQPLFSGIPNLSYVYFNHTYYCNPKNGSVIAAETDYGINFCSAIQNKNVFGVQFHPEKSQTVGKNILQNFIKISPTKEAL